MSGDVKTRRRYNSSGRREQARRTRELLMDTAERQFLDAGYAATTVGGIAAEAGVSVETVYKAFGGKSGLVRAIYDWGLLGPAGARHTSARTRCGSARPIPG